MLGGPENCELMGVASVGTGALWASVEGRANALLAAKVAAAVKGTQKR